MTQEKTGGREGRRERVRRKDGGMEGGLGEIYRSAFPLLSLDGRNVFFLRFYAFQFYIF